MHTYLLCLQQSTKYKLMDQKKQKSNKKKDVRLKIIAEQEIEID